MYLPAIGTMPAAYQNPCSHAPVQMPLAKTSCACVRPKQFLLCACDGRLSGRAGQDGRWILPQAGQHAEQYHDVLSLVANAVLRARSARKIDVFACGELNGMRGAKEMRRFVRAPALWAVVYALYNKGKGGLTLQRRPWFWFSNQGFLFYELTIGDHMRHTRPIALPSRCRGPWASTPADTWHTAPYAWCPLCGAFYYVALSTT